MMDSNNEENRLLKCELTPVLDVEHLHSARKYEFMLIHNTSQNAIELLSFEVGKGTVSIDKIILAKQAILLALPSYEKPLGLIVNYSGSILCYSIKSSVGFLRPKEIR